MRSITSGNGSASWRGHGSMGRLARLARCVATLRGSHRSSTRCTSISGSGSMRSSSVGPPPHWCDGFRRRALRPRERCVAIARCAGDAHGRFPRAAPPGLASARSRRRGVALRSGPQSVAPLSGDGRLRHRRDLRRRRGARRDPPGSWRAQPVTGVTADGAAVLRERPGPLVYVHATLVDSALRVASVYAPDFHPPSKTVTSPKWRASPSSSASTTPRRPRRPRATRCSPISRRSTWPGRDLAWLLMLPPLPAWLRPAYGVLFASAVDLLPAAPPSTPPAPRVATGAAGGAGGEHGPPRRNPRTPTAAPSHPWDDSLMPARLFLALLFGLAEELALGLALFLGEDVDAREVDDASASSSSAATSAAMASGGSWLPPRGQRSVLPTRVDHLALVLRAVRRARPRRLGREIEHALTHGLAGSVGPALVVLAVAPHCHTDHSRCIQPSQLVARSSRNRLTLEAALERVARHFLAPADAEERHLLVRHDTQRALGRVGDRRDTSRWPTPPPAARGRRCRRARWRARADRGRAAAAGAPT